MQRAEMDELRMRDSNLTALLAIGPRKKPRLDGDTATASVVSLNWKQNYIYLRKKKINKIKKISRREQQQREQVVHHLYHDPE